MESRSIFSHCCHLQAVAGMGKFLGAHSSTVSKTSAFAGQSISPFHMKRRSSLNSSTVVGAMEEKFDAKEGEDMGNDADARYLPQLRRIDGCCDTDHSMGC